MESIIEKLSKGTRRVLDVGSGFGEYLENLQRKFGFKAIGIDPYTMERKEEGLEILRMKAEELWKLKGWFDLIYTLHSLHHFSEPEKFIFSSSEKLSFNGKFVIVDWREGANTGVREKYFSHEELLRFFEGKNLKILWHSVKGDEQAIVAVKKEVKIAVATDDGENIFSKMFGRASFFDLYLLSLKEFKFLERRGNIYRDSFQHLKTYDVYEIVSDCEGILTGKIGKKGEERLSSFAVEIFKAEGKIEDRIKDIVRKKDALFWKEAGLFT